jgi:hypothetical protein
MTSAGRHAVGAGAQDRVVSGITAMSHARRYGRDAALWTSVRGISCRSMRSRVDRFKADGIRVHQVTNGPLVGLTAGHCSQHPRIAPSGTSA